VAVDDLWKILADFVSQLEKLQHFSHLTKTFQHLVDFTLGKKISMIMRGICMFEGGNLLNLTPVTNTPKTLQPGLQFHEL